MDCIMNGMTGFDLFSLIVNNGVVIFIAIFTFVYIDRKNVKRMKNQEEAAKFFLLKVFDNCKKTVELFDDDSIVKLIVKKTDFDKPETADDPSKKLENSAFENEAIVFDSFKEGLLSRDTIKAYMEMKYAFQMFMSTRVVLFDAPEVWEPLRNSFFEKYNCGLELLQSDTSEKKERHA